jgi:coenzyme F420-0:L-glutamate ligase / coenzyme F420-1:gamma-L-glutamate ligase
VTGRDERQAAPSPRGSTAPGAAPRGASPEEAAGGPPPGAAPAEPAGRLLAVPLPPLPDIRPGDDLAVMIAQAAQAGAADDPDLALRAGDVLVVTQKVVSKAEGRVVDLRTVTPRPEALAFAVRWNRDPRQVEVVLRESVRVVRMERGVIVSRTAHGYVCANAGVDASNTDSPDLVTLLPEDPDRSAREIRGRLRDLLGVDVAVVVADSFGRPWRWGITDIALGVSGFAPLADFRGMADTAGREMHATVVAVADEICAAAELASGKTSRRPVVLVRGAPIRAGDGSIVGDVVMPEAFDLFA